MIMPSFDAIIVWNVLEETGRCRWPAPVGRVGNGDALHAAGHTDISEPAFFVVIAVERRKKTILPRDQENMRKFEAFCTVQRQELHGVHGVFARTTR